MDSQEIETGVGAMKLPDRKVGQSRKTEVYAYTSPELVIKIPNTNEKVFDSQQSAINEIKAYEEARKVISDLVEKNGGRGDIIEGQRAIIHDSRGGGVSYTRVQKWFKNSHPVSEMGFSILNLPKQSLIDLRSIFETNIELWKQKGAFLDIVGSTVSKRSIFSKISRHLLPLLYSENIIIDQENNPHFIDIGGINNINTESFLTKLRCYLQIIGSYVSIGLINASLSLK